MFIIFVLTFYFNKARSSASNSCYSQSACDDCGPLIGGRITRYTHRPSVCLSVP